MLGRFILAVFCLVWGTFPIAFAADLELQVSAGHIYSLTCLAYSPDGKLLVTGSFDDRALLWDAATGQQIRSFTGHTKLVKSVAISPDGKRLVSGSTDGTARLWNLQTGEEWHQFKPAGHISCVCLSPDGKTLVTGTERSAILWDLDTKQKRFEWDQAYVNCAIFSADAQSLITGSASGEAIEWTIPTGEKKQTFVTSDVRDLALSADGKLLAAGTNSAAIVWDFKTGKKLHTFGAQISSMTKVSISPDCKTLVTGHEDRTAQLWDLATGAKLRSWGHSAYVNAVRFSPDGKALAVATNEPLAIVWDVETGKKRCEFQGRCAMLASLRVSPNNQFLATGGYARTAYLWNLTEAQPPKTLVTNPGFCLNLAFSGDSQLVATAGSDQTIHCWSLPRAEHQRRINPELDPARDNLHEILLNHQGISLLAKSNRENVSVWNMLTGQATRQLDGFSKIGNSFGCYSPNGKFCVLADGDDPEQGDRTAVLWNVANNEAVRKFSGHNAKIYSACLSPEGQLLLTGAGDHTARLWEVATGKEIRQINVKSALVNTVAFSPDGKTLITQVSDGQIILWETATGKQQCEIKHGGTTLIFKALSADGKLLLTTTFAQQCDTIIWEVATGKILATIPVGNYLHHAAEFSADSQWLLTSSRQGTIQLWDMPHGKQLATLYNLDRGDNWLVTTPEGYYDGSPEGKKLVQFRISGTNTLIPTQEIPADFQVTNLLQKIWRGESFREPIRELLDKSTYRP